MNSINELMNFKQALEGIQSSLIGLVKLKTDNLKNVQNELQNLTKVATDMELEKAILNHMEQLDKEKAKTNKAIENVSKVIKEYI